MSGDYQDFGYEDKPETCLWCGRKLKHLKVIDPEASRTTPGHYVIKPADKLGSQQDDCFCGLRCGYQFGVRMAELGERLAKSHQPSVRAEEEA
jgi:hypothetical protein